MRAGGVDAAVPDREVTTSHEPVEVQGGDVEVSGWAGGLLGGGDDVEHQRFGLQLVRTSGPLDIARATVRAFGPAVPDPWRLSTYAVCGPRKDGIVAAARVATGPFVGVSCPRGTSRSTGRAAAWACRTAAPTGSVRCARRTCSHRASMTVRMSLQDPGYRSLLTRPAPPGRSPCSPMPGRPARTTPVASQHSSSSRLTESRSPARTPRVNCSPNPGRS